LSFDQAVIRGPLLLVLVAFLTACATVAEQDPTTTSPLLQQISASATGDFSTSLDDTDPALLLTVSSEPLVPANRELTLNLFQQSSDAPARRFRLSLKTTDVASAYPLSGTLAPLLPNGRAIAECPVVVRTSSMGLSVMTEAASCQFGTGNERVGLAKELLFSGSQVRIADRLVSLAQTGQDDVPLTELRFYRLNRYTGWIGVSEGGQWRIAREIQVDTANGRIEPLDAAGMSLGVIIQLDQTMLEGASEQPIVRLTILNAKEETTLARSWSEPGAQRIGIATPQVQVGLERVRTP